MSRTKIAITVNEEALTEIDRLVREGVYPNRSRAIEVAVIDSIERSKHSRLARECAKLEPTEEEALANETYAAETAWPEY